MNWLSSTSLYASRYFISPLIHHGSWYGEDINGTEWADKVWGGNGFDTVHGYGGNDFIDGEEGDDWLYGDAGHDTVLGDQGNDWLFGGSGDDFLKGDDDFNWQGNDVIFGENGRDNIFGMGGNDLLYGGADNDSIGGGDGNDYISGGTGRDLLRGEGGTDTFSFALGDSWVGTNTSDHISDFRPWPDNDRIDVNDYVMSHSTIAASGSFGSIEAAANYAFTMQYYFYHNAGSALIADHATGNAYLLQDQDGDRYFETGVILDGAANWDVNHLSNHDILFT